jgi:hypothetical protein
VLLRALPFTTFGEIAALDLEVEVRCAGCGHEVKIDPAGEQLRNRPFAGAPFRCTATIKRYTAHPAYTCGQPSHVYIRPRERLQVGGPVTVAFLFCRRCAPYGWQIDQVQLDKPPWSATRLGLDDRFRCPTCRGRVDWHIHATRWLPRRYGADSRPLLTLTRPVAILTQPNTPWSAKSSGASAEYTVLARTLPRP